MQHVRHNKRLFAYIDEAVVEEEAEDGGGHPRLPLHGGGHPLPHDGGQVRARRRVEVGRQLRVRRAAEDGEDDGEGNEAGRPGEGSHGTMLLLESRGQCELGGCGCHEMHQAASYSSYL